MYENILVETSLVPEIYKEYLTLVNYYKNVKRPSVFARYLNINLPNSIYDLGTEASFDHYNSGIKYDIYDYAPFYATSQVINESTISPDLKGHQFSGFLTLTSYAISLPRVNDLVLFPYIPSSNMEIFRVTDIRASYNAMKSDPNVNWFDLTLEYAPLLNINKINILHEYVYSLTLERFLRRDLFIILINQVQKLSDLMLELQLSFNDDLELYTYVYEDSVIAPLNINNIIYNFLCINSVKYNKYFERSKRPFGIKKYGVENIIDLNGEVLDIDPDIDTYNGSILSYNDTINIYDMSYLLGIFEYV